MNTLPSNDLLPNGTRPHILERYLHLPIGLSFYQLLKRYLPHPPSSVMITVAMLSGLVAVCAIAWVSLAWVAALVAVIGVLGFELCYYTALLIETHEEMRPEDRLFRRGGFPFRALLITLFYGALAFRMAVWHSADSRLTAYGWGAVILIAALLEGVQTLLYRYYHQVYAFWDKGQVSRQMEQALKIRIAASSSSGKLTLRQRIAYHRLRFCEKLTPQLQNLLSRIYRIHALSPLSEERVASLRNDSAKVLDLLLPLSFSVRVLLILISVLVQIYWIYWAAVLFPLFFYLWGIQAWYEYRCQKRADRLISAATTPRHPSPDDVE